MISRAIGEHQLSIGGASEKRLMFPYSQWMMQRPLSFYQGLGDSDRMNVDQMLSACGGVEAMNFKISQPVQRRKNQLVVAK